MFRALFHVYQRAPYRLKQVLARVAGVPRFFARPFVRSVQVGGCKMVLNASDNAAFRYWNYRSSYEPSVTEMLLRLISANPGCYFLDLGANYGAFTLAAANMGRYGTVKKIFAFEPDGKCCQALRDSCSANHLNGLVAVEQSAVGDSTGKTQFFPSARSSTSNRTFQTSSETLRFSRSSEVPCTALDDFLTAQGVDVAREKFVIKIDIEGNELRAFKGMGNLLSRAGYAIVFEYFPVDIREVGLVPSNLRSFVSALNPEFSFVQGKDGTFQRCASTHDLCCLMEELEQSPEPMKAIGCFLIASRISVSEAL